VRLYPTSPLLCFLIIPSPLLRQAHPCYIRQKNRAALVGAPASGERSVNVITGNTLSHGDWSFAFTTKNWISKRRRPLHHSVRAREQAHRLDIYRLVCVGGMA